MKKITYIIIVLIVDIVLVLMFYRYHDKLLPNKNLETKEAKFSNKQTNRIHETSGDQEALDLFLSREYMGELGYKAIQQGDRKAFKEWMEIYSRCGLQYEFDDYIYMFADRTKSLDYFMIYVSSISDEIVRMGEHSSRKYLYLYYLKKLMELNYPIEAHKQYEDLLDKPSMYYLLKFDECINSYARDSSKK